MNRLKSFAAFVNESVTPDEIITKGAAENLKGKKETEDEGLIRLGDEKAAEDKKAAEETAAAAAAAAAKTVAPTAPAAPKAGRTLIKGGTEAVARWQEKLVAAGADIKVDGGWGKNTQAAYVKYIEGKYGADSAKAKKVQGGVAPAVAQSSPGGKAWKVVKASVAGLAAGLISPVLAPVAAGIAYASKF